MTALILLTAILALTATAVGLVVLRRKDAGSALVALVVMMIAATLALAYAATNGE